jgi:hypothetical protein
MKPTNLLMITAIGALAILSSCKKDDASGTTDSEAVVEQTFQLGTDNAMADEFVELDNDLLLQSAQDRNLLGGRFYPQGGEPENLIPCATITVTPATGFPKTIRISFDSTCTAPGGVVRSGVVQIVISDSIRRPGATSVMTFENYYVNHFRREGTITWTNTSVPPVRSWRREVVGGKITAPNGAFWLHESIKNVTQTAGSSTVHIIDDVFSISGNGSITNPAGITRTATIIEPLQKKVACHNIDKGKVKFQGPHHFAILNYGDGTCDNLATISIDGRPPRTIILP